MAVTPRPTVQLTTTGVMASSGIAKAHQHGWSKVSRVSHGGTEPAWKYGPYGDSRTLIEQPGAGGVAPEAADYFVVIPAGMQAASELGERLRQIAPAMTPYSAGLCTTAIRPFPARADLHLLVAPGTTVEMIDWMITQVPSGWGLGTVRFWNPSGTRVYATVENPLVLTILLSAETFLKMGAKRAADHLTEYIAAVSSRYAAGACTFDVRLNTAAQSSEMAEKNYWDFVGAVLRDPRMGGSWIPFLRADAIPDSFTLAIRSEWEASDCRITSSAMIRHVRAPWYGMCNSALPSTIFQGSTYKPRPGASLLSTA